MLYKLAQCMRQTTCADQSDLILVKKAAFQNDNCFQVEKPNNGSKDLRACLLDRLVPASKPVTVSRHQFSSTLGFEVLVAAMDAGERVRLTGGQLPILHHRTMLTSLS